MLTTASQYSPSWPWSSSISTPGSWSTTTEWYEGTCTLFLVFTHVQAYVDICTVLSTWSWCCVFNDPILSNHIFYYQEVKITGGQDLEAYEKMRQEMRRNERMRYDEEHKLPPLNNNSKRYWECFNVIMYCLFFQIKINSIHYLDQQLLQTYKILCLSVFHQSKIEHEKFLKTLNYRHTWCQVLRTPPCPSWSLRSERAGHSACR